MAPLLFVLLAVPAADCAAQLLVSGQSAAHFSKSARTRSPRAENAGRPVFGWSTVLFLDARVTEQVSALGTVESSYEQGLDVTYAAIRIADLTPLHLSVTAGKFDLPFGNLGERRFPRRNALFSLPLIYEYRTTLPNVFATQGELLFWRAGDWGMPLLDRGMYDPGAMVSGSASILDYAVAVTTASISGSSYAGSSSNDNLGLVGRIAVTPFTGLTIGLSGAWGSYLKEGLTPPPRPIDLGAYKQRAGAVDIDFSRGHAVLSGALVASIWRFPLETRDDDFTLTGYYLEGKYTLLPRLYAALRANGLIFGTNLLKGVQQAWDFNVQEWEGGLGYFLDRDVLVKLVRRETRIQGGTHPKDNLTALQIAVAY